MKLADWTLAVSTELRDAGFEVSELQGFPLVKIPETHMETVRFLKFHTALPADRRIYAEGAMFLPATSWLASPGEEQETLRADLQRLAENHRKSVAPDGTGFSGEIGKSANGGEEKG